MAGLSQPELLVLCLRLAKYKKENKELLGYLLFQSEDETAYKEAIKKQITELFQGINKSNLYFAKKGIRKILRIVQKQIKFSGSKQTEAELLIYYLREFKESGLPITKSKVLSNLYDRLLKKIELAVSTLHEDLQYDLAEEIAAIKN